jgi:rhodanese-related sulfurtransferase
MILLVSLQTGLTTASSGTVREIIAPELKEMMGEGKVVVVNVLSRIEYDMQHIPGSINIPFTEMKTTDKLPAEKTTPLVFYCQGEK